MASHKVKAFLLFTLVFALFYVMVSAETCIVDDFSAIMNFSNGQGTSLREIFLPGSAGGGYYRPLIGLSYLVNLRLWDLDGGMLHLENVLLHAVNALMVYLLTLSILRRLRRECNLAPLVAGLLFGLHPITTESVNWISGRTDLIAGFFGLLALLLLVRYTTTGSRYLLAGAGLSVLLGLLGKETALALIPGALLLLSAHRGEQSLPSPAAAKFSLFSESLLFLLFAGGTVLVQMACYNFWIVLFAAPLYLFSRHVLRGGELPARAALVFWARRSAGYAAALLLAVGIFFGIRSIVFTSSLPRIPQTIKLMLQDLNYTLSVFSGATGFYVKKYFLPFPLNFAIREIDPAYTIVGTLLCFVVALLAVRRTFAASFALVGLFLFAPALPFALGTVAWTAYAERYIYISSAFWAVALVLWCMPLFERQRRLGVAVVTVLLLVMAGTTLQRNLIWQTNLALARDTAEKSPRFREVHVIYMNELLKAGDLVRARAEYRIASPLPSLVYHERLDALMAGLCLREGKEDEALGLYRLILDKTRGESRHARERIDQLLRARADRAKDPAARRAALLELEQFRTSPPGPARAPAAGTRVDAT